MPSGSGPESPGSESVPTATREGSGRRGRRGRVVAGVVAGVVVAGVAVAAGFGVRLGGPAPTTAAATGSWSTVKVARQTLSISTSVDGTLGYGAATPLRVKAGGTITWLPGQGRVIKRGQSLMRVDDRPVVVLYGTIPMYRDLGLSAGNSPSPAGTATGASNAVGLLAGNSAKSSAPTSPSTHTSPTAVTGRDVRQLEENLRALGYRGFTVDSTFNQATAVAVKKWQKDLGLPQTGTVAQGDVVFASGPMRVAQALAKVGDEASGDMLSVTGLTRAVTAAASAQDTAWAGLGNTVTLTLPNGTTTPGKVIHVGTAATAPTGQDGAGNGAPATVPVTITITNQKDLGTLTSGPVSVTYVSQVAKDVLAVPVEALVALAEGGYGLEVVDPKGSHYVGVKTGMFTDALVEITSDQISEGTTVRVPQ